MGELIHEVENGHHRLAYTDGKQGEWVSYDQIARLDDFGAVTNHFAHSLPTVFKVIEVTDYKRHHLVLPNTSV